MKWLTKFNIDASQKTEILQLIYALLVIILIPAAFALNTIYLLKGVERDMDYELNNKALLVATTISKDLQNKLNDNAFLQQHLVDIVNSVPEIKAVELLRVNNDEMSPIVSTSPTTKLVSDSVLNQMAWGTNQAFSKQINARVGSSKSERIWLVASPLHDQAKKKIGLINVYISAAEIDIVTNRTMHDSLIILSITMFFILLLLLNHFRFYETSLLFIKLHEIDKLKDDFLSMASHELRAPLIAIVGYVYLLTQNKQVKENPELAQEIQGISKNAERLKSLIEDLLDVSRIEQSRMVFEFVSLDLRQIIQEVVAEHMMMAQEKKLSLSYTQGDTPLIVNGDKNKIKQIFINLVNNAIKYTPSGSIVVFHEIQRDLVRTYVKDSGVGISDEDRSRLFGKFNRIYNEKTQNVPGTGLGLWITKQLVEKMNGKISVESIKNVGTQFIVSFPIAKTS